MFSTGASHLKICSCATPDVGASSIGPLNCDKVSHAQSLHAFSSSEIGENWTTFCKDQARLNLRHPQLSALAEDFLLSRYEWSFTKSGHSSLGEHPRLHTCL